VKEYLSVRGIGFQSINVLDDADGMAEMRRLGARSLPVVARGGDFVIGQVMRDVVDFLGLEADAGPALSPDELMRRYDDVLVAALRLTRAMPDAALANELPNRPRSWRVLMHHVFQIPVAFLDMEETGKSLSAETMLAPPPDDMRTTADIAAFGDAVRARFAAWRDRARGADFTVDVPTYFGGTSRHEMLERTVWHSTQHVRQVASLLEQTGVVPDGPAIVIDVSGLPLTDRIWDQVE